LKKVKKTFYLNTASWLLHALFSSRIQGLVQVSSCSSFLNFALLLSLVSSTERRETGLSTSLVFAFSARIAEGHLSRQTTQTRCAHLKLWSSVGDSGALRLTINMELFWKVRARHKAYSRSRKDCALAHKVRVEFSSSPVSNEVAENVLLGRTVKTIQIEHLRVEAEHVGLRVRGIVLQVEVAILVGDVRDEAGLRELPHRNGHLHSSPRSQKETHLDHISIFLLALPPPGFAFDEQFSADEFVRKNHRCRRQSLLIFFVPLDI